MTEQTSSEKKKKSNKGLYWSLGISAALAFFLPEEIRRTILIVSGVGIALIGIYKYNQSNKKLKPLQDEADKINKQYNREVGKVEHYVNASLEQANIAMQATKPDEIEDALHYQELFASEARKRKGQLDPIPSKVTRLTDRLPKK